MRRVMFIWLPRWPIDRQRSRPQVSESRQPFVLATTLGNRRLVSAVDAQAAREGIAPGMALTDARALHPDLAVAEADFAGDAASLGRLAQWCGRFSPWTAPAPPDGVWLDVTGCAHLHGGEEGLLDEAIERLKRLGIAATAAIADTAGAAWAVAHHIARTAIVPPGETRAALADLPVVALRLAPELAETLVRLGLRRIGELYPMPRPSLVLRFGRALAARLDQALGVAAEPLSPLPPPRLRWARRRFAEPTATAEAIEAATSELVAAVCHALGEAGEGARRLELTLHRVDGTPHEAQIGTARPSREPRHLLRLFAERLGAIDPGLGIEDMLLAATVFEPQGPAQLALTSLSSPSPVHNPPPRAGESRVGAAAAVANDDTLAALVDRLAARLGEDAVSRPLLVESHWPERAVAFVPPFARARNARSRGAERPVRFLRRPEPIEAVAPVPDDPPLMFRWRKVMHRVRRADGPERIAGEWWRGPAELRDYYRVEDREGRRFWLYRSGLYRADKPARWYLHGVFA